MEQLLLRVIGKVRSPIKPGMDIPKNYDESGQTGELEIEPEFSDGLDGIRAGQTIVVLCWLDQADRQVLRVYPRGDKTRGLRGVFATRSPARPNPIALSEFEVLAIEGLRITVAGVDVLDQTPILDIKKKIE